MRLSFSQPAVDPPTGLAGLFARAVLRLVRAVLPLVLLAVTYAGICVGLWSDAEARSRRARVGAEVGSGLWEVGSEEKKIPTPHSPLLNTVELAHLPPWLTGRDLAAIRALGRAAQGRSLMERGLTERLARAYRASPWVRRVAAVRRQFPDRILVELVIRKPFAQVRVGADRLYYLVDDRGVRLPRDPTRKPRGADPDRLVPRILNPAGEPPAEGEPFVSREVADALDILRLLAAFGPEAWVRDPDAPVAGPSRDPVPARRWALEVTALAFTDFVGMGLDRRRRVVVHCSVADPGVAADPNLPTGWQTRLIWGVHYRAGELAPYGIVSACDKLRALAGHLAALGSATLRHQSPRRRVAGQQVRSTTLGSATLGSATLGSGTLLVIDVSVHPSVYRFAEP